MAGLKFPVLILSMMVLVVMSLPVKAEVPAFVDYQGRVTDDAGQPINAPKLIKFKIYGSESGDDSLWSSGYQVVQINEGLFNYRLGSHVPLPEDLFTGNETRYLGITIDTDAEIQPRTQLVSVPYAVHAGLADSLGDAPYVHKTGDTISGHMYFDGDGLGKDAELLLFNDLSIMNFYQSGAKRITFESEFGTVVLRGQDGDLSLWMSGGEDEEEGGLLQLYDKDGALKMRFDASRTGDLTAVLPDDAVNADEMLNEPGIGTNAISGYLPVTTSTMSDLVTLSVTIPAPGYVHVTGKAIVRRYLPAPTDECECGAYLQIDTTSGGSWTLPYFSFVSSWVTTNVESTPFVERTFYVSSAGTYEFRLEASRYASSEDCNVLTYSRMITAVYYPTYYGETK